VQVNTRRLYRSRRDRQLAGVAGGIAEYLEIDPTVVRILWILSVFFGGFSILVYVVMAFVVPLEPAAGQPPAWPGAGAETPDAPDAIGAVSGTAGGGGPHRGAIALGVLLVVFGSIALLGAVVPSWVVGFALGPAFLVALGVALIVVATRRKTSDA
jgi:phage shock protein C